MKSMPSSSSALLTLPVILAVTLSFVTVGPLTQAQTTFTGEGDWLESERWDGDVPADNSTAIINGEAIISEDITTQNSINPSRIEIGTGADGSLTVNAGTLGGAHGGGQGIFVGVGAGGNGTLIINEGAAFRSQGGNMTVRIGDDAGGIGKVVVAGELLNYKFFELINGTLEMRPNGINSKFNQLDSRSPIGPNGILHFVIDGDQVGSMVRSNTNGLNVDIDPGATLQVTLNGDFGVGDSWLLMDYTNVSGQFAQGTSFVNEQGYEFQVNYGSGNNDEMTLTLISTDARPSIESFTAEPVLIASGEETTLQWQVNKFTGITIDQDVGDVTANTTDNQGQVVVSPTETTTYEMTVDFNGITASQTLTVVVDGVPLIQDFSAASELLAPGQETTLKWNVAGADSVSIEPGIGDVAAVGETNVTPDETTAYKLRATNANGSTSQDLSVTVNALEAAIINLYEAEAENQTDGALKDAVGIASWDVKNGELVDVTSERTTISRAHRMVTFNNDTGSDNGNGFPGGSTTYEVWMKTGDFTEDLEHQVIFETGGGLAGSGILVTPGVIRFIHSQGGTRSIDLEVSLLQINTDDYIQIVTTLDHELNMATLHVRGAGGGQGSASGAGTLGKPNGRATLFSHSNFSAGISSALGGVGGDEPELVTQFTGEIAVVKVYNRSLSTAEVDQAFKKLAVAGEDDADNDGLLDFWEVRFFGNTNATANQDTDGDGLSNLGEFESGALPNMADSDGDGLSDGDEVNTHGSNPVALDSDGDGLLDGQEVNELGTSPSKADTDEDGFRDDVEVALATNPASAESSPPANAILLTRAPTGAEDWHSPEIWADGMAPSADKDYFVVGSLSDTLPTPTLANPTFNGGSLVLAGDAHLDLRHQGSASIPLLTVRNKASIIIRSDATLAGELQLEGELTLDHRTEGTVFDLASRLTGEGAIVLTHDTEAFEETETRLSKPGSDYTADWTLQGGTLKAAAANSLGKGNVKLIYGVLDADYNVNLPTQTLSIVGDNATLCLDQTMVFHQLDGLSPEDGTSVLFTLPDGEYDANVLINDVGFGDNQVKGTETLALVGTTGDTDSDGLLDSWELETFGDLAQDADSDSDEDGLSSGDEFSAGSSPTEADSDGDGLADGLEVNEIGSNPNQSDSDGDGLSDAEEVESDTPSSPLLVDTDGDGLTDAEEVNGDPKTDPSKEDTDDDGFRDAFELSQGSDPTDANSLPEDQLGEPSETWTELATLPTFDGIREGADLLDATFRMWVDFEEKTEGERELLFETGGATIGHSVVYEAPNKIVYRADGNGGFSLAVIEHSLTADQLAAGELELIWTYDAINDEGTQTIALYLDGESVGSVSMDIGGDWSGANGAAFGVASASIAGDGQNNVLTSEDFQSGEINVTDGLQFFANFLFVGSGQGPIDPPNPPGVPTITTVSMGSDGIIIEWEGAEAVDVEYSPLQTANGWQSIASGVQGGRFEDSDAGRGAEPTGFYRLQPAAQ